MPLASVASRPVVRIVLSLPVIVASARLPLRTWRIGAAITVCSINFRYASQPSTLRVTSSAMSDKLAPGWQTWPLMRRFAWATALARDALKAAGSQLDVVRVGASASAPESFDFEGVYWLEAPEL